MAVDFRSLPSVDKLLADERIQELIQTYSREAVLDLIRHELDDARQAIGRGAKAPDPDELAQAVQTRADAVWQPWPRPLINATGVILHTNLGRAPLSTQATEAVLQAAKGYTNLEMELEEGKRGSRQDHVARVLAQLTGAEAALVVNNNASAVLLGLAAIAKGQEVIVSRGEAVEIGGGFRIPDVMRQSGSTLVEVGTTNRTYITDYEDAITESTAALLKVHASNFRISGFTYSPETEELVALGTRYHIPILHDIGSGCLLDTTQFGLAHEPMPQESVKAEAGLAFFSGDKLLGGPQAGIVVGQLPLVERLARHPLARAFRIDKLSLAALSATLLHYIKGEELDKIPIWRMIAVPTNDLEVKAQQWEKAIGSKATVVKGFSTIGGGSLPGETLHTWLLTLGADGLPGGAQGLSKRLREGSPPVIGRIEEERIVLDPRTVLPEEESHLLRVVKEALASNG